MRSKIFISFILLALAISFFNCGVKKGASSPQELFNTLKTVDPNKMSQGIDYVAPDERSLLAFSMDFAMAFMFAFVPDKKLQEEYLQIRKKYNLPETKDKSSLDLKDPQSVLKYAEDNYGGIDHAGFLSDMESLMEKAPGKKTKKPDYKELKDVKIEGDRATGTIVYENGKTEKVTFRKVNNAWYLSMKDSFLKR